MHAYNCILFMCMYIMCIYMCLCVYQVIKVIGYLKQIFSYAQFESDMFSIEAKDTKLCCSKSDFHIGDNDIFTNVVTPDDFVAETCCNFQVNISALYFQPLSIIT